MATIPADDLLGGVSRQPEPIRLTNQLQEMIGCDPNISKGLTKRPSHTVLDQIPGASIDEDAFTHFFEDSGGRRYCMVIEGDTVQPSAPITIWDLDQTQATTVTFTDPDQRDYFIKNVGSIDRDTFRVVTVADSTFIINRDITVVQEPGTPIVTFDADVNNRALFIKQGKADSVYKVTITWVDDGPPVAHTATATVTTGTTTVTDRNPDKIAANIVTALGVDNAQFITDFDPQVEGGVIYFSTNVSKWENITIAVREDPVGQGQGMIAINGSVKVFTDLPASFRGTSRLLVKGDETNSFSDYFVRFTLDGDTASTSMGKGTWSETSELDDTGFDIETVAIILKVDRTTDVANKGHPFDIDFLLPDGTTYSDRIVGDSKSAADPTFVGKTIRDVFFHKNRLGFLTDENVVLSETSQFLNFYPTTVLDVLDSDPIDVAADSGAINILENAVSFDRNLIVFSKDTQFSLRGDQSGLGPSTAALNPVSYFESDILVRPVVTGKSIMFTNKQDTESSKVMEYQAVDIDLFDANDATTHIPKYMDGNVRGMASHATDRTTVLWTNRSDTDNLATLYINNFLWKGEAKIQNAWHKWELNNSAYEFGKIMGAHFFNDKLVVLLHEGNETDSYFVEIINDDPNVDIGTESAPKPPFKYSIDFRQDDTDFTIVPDGPNFKFTYVFGSEANLPEIIRISASDPKFQQIDIISSNDVAGGVEIVIAVDSDFIIGYAPNCSWKPSRPTATDQNGKPVLHMIQKMEIHDWRVYHENTKSYDVTTASRGRDSSTDTFEAATFEEALFNAVPLSTDDYESSIDLMYRDIDITVESNNIFPATWVLQEWHIDVHSSKG